MIDQSILQQHAQPVRDKVRFLDATHLKPELQFIVEMYEDLAANVLHQVPSSPELTLAMQKLVEAKDQAVRAKLHAAEKELKFFSNTDS
jgi:hypothetical protein